MGTICTERYCLSIGRFVPLLKERNEKAMKNDDDLKRIRENAVGIELDEELARQFPVKRQYEVQMPTRHGSVRVYVFRPLGEEKEACPVIINFHGGGFVKGYRGRDTLFSRNLACHTGCVVMDVDYKTAPEQKYPYALEEGYDAVEYIFAHSQEFGIDGKRIILSGQSAGGNLVTGVALMASEKGAFPIRLVILSYPPLDLARDPGGKRLADQDPERVETARLYNDWYIDENRRQEIYASPVYAPKEKLKGLPPFLIITAEKDPLGDEAEQFARQLLEAGVSVTAKRVAGAKHGFLVRRSQGFEVAEKLIFETVSHYSGTR